MHSDQKRKRSSTTEKMERSTTMKKEQAWSGWYTAGVEDYK
jgi:hypothetical protein